jgi:hypothetical protein
MSKQEFRTLKFQHLYRTIDSTTLIYFLDIITTAITAHNKVKTNKELKNVGKMVVGTRVHP